MLIIRRPQFQYEKLEAVNQLDAKYGVDDKVIFFDCHKQQPDWIKYQSAHSGVVKDIFRSDHCVDAVYKVYFPHVRCTKLIPESEIEAGLYITERLCSWGQLMNMSPDGMLVNLTKLSFLQPIIEDAVCCLRREVEDYLHFQRRLHIALKNERIHLKISADKTGAEFRLFGKTISYEQALSIEQIADELS